MNNYNSPNTNGSNGSNGSNVASRKNRKNNAAPSRKNRKNRKNNAAPSRKNRKNRKNNNSNMVVTRKNRQSGGKRSGVPAVGSRIQVMHGTADHTAGGLKKGDLMLHKGRIVSRKAHAAGKKAIQRLRAAGYIAKKGHFKLFSKKR